MPADSFNESLALNLVHLRERVLADHEKEVQRLSQVIEGLRSKVTRQANKINKIDADYASEGTDDSDDSSINEIAESCVEREASYGIKDGNVTDLSDCLDCLSSETTRTSFQHGFVPSGYQQKSNGGPAVTKSRSLPHKPFDNGKSGMRSLSEAWFGVGKRTSLLKRDLVILPPPVNIDVSHRHTDTSRSPVCSDKDDQSEASHPFSAPMPPARLPDPEPPSPTARGSQSAQTADFNNEFKVASAWRTGKASKFSQAGPRHQKRRMSKISVASPTPSERGFERACTIDRASTGSGSMKMGTCNEACSITSGDRMSGMSSPSFSDFAEASRGEPQHCCTIRMKRLMLQPSSWFHVCWNLCGLAFIIYDIVTVPLEIFNPADSAFVITMLVISSVFWTLDMAGTFFTGYMSVDGSVNMNPKDVAQRYAVTWLPLDCCTTICSWIALSGVHKSDRIGLQGLDPWRSILLVRVLRILRLLKAPEMEGFITEHIRSETTRLCVSIARLIVLLVLVAHLIACSWYGLGRYMADEGNTSSWIVRNNLMDEDALHNYAFAIHWSLSQFTGENIISLENVVERWFAIVIFIFAFLFSTIFVSSITTLMTRLQIIASKQSSQLSALRRYLHDNYISTPLAVRILRNARLAMKTNQRVVAEHSVELLQEISEPLQVELHFEVHFPTLAFHPFFKNYNVVNPAGMKKVCHQAVAITWLSPYDVVFSECETPERAEMYFVVKGELQYSQEGVHSFTRLCRGNWACEMVLWATQRQHTGTLSAMTESSLLSLDAEKFQKIVKTFPSGHARNYGKFFVIQMNERGKDEVSDVSGLDVEPLCEETFADILGPPMMGTTWSNRLSVGSRTSVKSLGHRQSLTTHILPRLSQIN